MGEGTHLATADRKSGPKQKLVLITAGTAAAVLAAGVLIQFFRAESGSAAVEPAAQTEQQAGTARVSRSPGRLQYLARVNKELVTWEQVADECMARYGEDVLDDVINRVIIQQACEARGITVTEDEVNLEVKRFATRFGLAVDQWYQMLLAEQKITPAQYRRDIIWPMLALKKLAGDQVDISEQDMQRAYVRNYGERVKARMILLDNQRRAQEIWEQLQKNPDEFERMAREHSVDPGSRALDGAIHPIPRYSSSPELENAAFKLKPGEISGMIQVGLNRYAILKSDGLTEPKVRDIEEVRDVLYEELHQERVQQSVAKVFEQVKKQSRVDNYLTNTSTGTQEDAAIRQTGGTQAPAGAPRTANSAPQASAPATRR